MLAVGSPACGQRTTSPPNIMAKHYTDEDPLHGNGKAVPKPHNPGDGKGFSMYRRIIPASAINSAPNSRVRMSKKQRIRARQKV
jgi:hypothetical protein